MRQKLLAVSAGLLAAATAWGFVTNLEWAWDTTGRTVVAPKTSEGANAAALDARGELVFVSLPATFAELEARGLDFQEITGQDLYTMPSGMMLLLR